MECLETLRALEAASTKLRTPFLAHLFRDFSPSHSTLVQHAMVGFHPRDRVGDVYDFRAAHHQFADWLFGWNVSELSENTANNTASPSRMGSAGAMPRDIDLTEASERQECLRLIETFTTQYTMAVRHLHRACIHLEERVPLIGKNLANLANGGDDGSGEHDDEHAVWGSAVGAGSGGPSLDNVKGVSRRGSMIVTPAGSNTHLASPLKSVPEAISGMVEADGGDARLEALLRSVERTLDDSPKAKNGDPSNASDAGSTSSLAPPIPPPVSKRKSVAPARRSSLRPPASEGSESDNSAPKSRRGSIAGNAPLPRIAASSKGTRVPSSSDVRSNPSRPGSTAARGRDTSPGRRRQPSASRPSSSSPTPPPLAGPSASSIPDQDVSSSNKPKPSAAPAKPTATTAIVPIRQLNDDEVLQNDLDLVFLDVSMTMDLYMASIISIVVVLSFAELLNDRALYSRFSAHAQHLCVQLVSTSIRITWDLVRRAVPATGAPTPTAAQLGDLGAFAQLMTLLLKTRAHKPGDQTFLAMSRLHAKLAVLHQVFVGVDVFLFPPLVPAHTGSLASAMLGGTSGVKSMSPTAFDNNIWATGGYDCKVRIWDMAEGGCLAQFAGHKSIVTDVHFIKNDAFIVSSSFDKTIKVWNAQTATCERTLAGHTDAITSCDVSPDARYILSGGLDTTLRLWEFVSGDCLAVVKKHTRYIKCVKFSPDGRYAASAGLDRRVYIWDVKILAYSKNITHIRCIEAHDDYILALDMARPSLLVTTSRDMFVKLWDYMSGHCIYQISLAPAWACTVAFGSDAELFAVGCFDNSVHVFKTKTSERVRMLKVLNSGVLAVRFPKRGYESVLVGTQEGFLQKLRL
ncbi:WD40-repeat-containing domain protein [Catenaria anguillulae PL171]|uniref:WD40-repeat-containing domain protein n=1 Tax=Catenaria anguillulae PL171 TaxID=765915 RepID=A0A1Y2HYK2_9FUNG|nr:WD40-repeat-containing domain protein [Catenaria anguillulae PL171]